MKVLVIVAHPNIKTSRANRQWIQELEMHSQITIHHLYQEYPDYQIDIEREQQLLIEHDRIVFQFPFYWYSCPPLLKKWFDDVLTYGWAFGVGGDRLEGKEFMVATTAGGPKDVYRAGGNNNFTIDELLRPIQATIMTCNGIFLSSYALYHINQISDEQIQLDAKEYVQYILRDQRLEAR